MQKHQHKHGFFKEKERNKCQLINRKFEQSK